jgi:hypothetical protein
MRKYQLYVFCSERGPMTAESFHTLISRLGERAGAFLIHLHHGCGYALPQMPRSSTP